MNDGTVTTLLQVRPAGREVSLAADRLKAWANQAASSDAVANDQLAQVRSYVEMVVLDYLAGNLGRQTVHLDEAGGQLYLVDNADAFPGFLSPEAAAISRRKLVALVRFPKGLGQALKRLDHSAAERLFCSGPFERWLLDPRQLIDLVERRTTLLTLLEARVVQYGQQVVFSLGD